MIIVISDLVCDLHCTSSADICLLYCNTAACGDVTTRYYTSIYQSVLTTFTDENCNFSEKKQQHFIIKFYQYYQQGSDLSE